MGIRKWTHDQHARHTAQDGDKNLFQVAQTGVYSASKCKLFFYTKIPIICPNKPGSAATPCNNVILKSFRGHFSLLLYPRRLGHYLRRCNILALNHVVPASKKIAPPFALTWGSPVVQCCAIQQQACLYSITINTRPSRERRGPGGAAGGGVLEQPFPPSHPPPPGAIFTTRTPRKARSNRGGGAARTACISQPPAVRTGAGQGSSVGEKKNRARPA